MNFVDKMIDRFFKLNRRLKKWQRVVSVLSAVVVFITTYTLILPAITLDKETASTQAGMEIAASENEPSSDGTVYEAEPEEEPEAEPAEESQEEEAVEETQEEVTVEEPQEEATAEDSGSDSGSQEAEVSTDQPANENADNAASNEDATAAESEQEVESKEEETAPAASGETVEAPASGETTEIAKPVEEIQLITEKTQLIYKYIDESFENDPEDEVDDGYTVYAEFDADAKLPVGVELKVKEITKESDPEAYEAYYEKALSEMQDKYDENTGLSFAKFYDISFVYNGKEVEPSGSVKVRIEYNKPVEVKTDENIDTVHFDKNNEEKPEVIQSEVDTKKQDEEDAMKAVEFESDQFSVYGVVGTNSLIATFVGTDGNTYEVKVTCDAESGIPSDAELLVSEVSEESEKYNTYLGGAVEVLGVEEGAIAYKKLLDISIVKDGVELTPKSPVSVEIKLLDKEGETEETKLNVIHYEGKSENPTVVEDTKEEEGTVKFETEGFSVYGVFYTVDFFYEVDGKVFEYHMIGGGALSYRELLSALHILDKDNQGLDIASEKTAEVSETDGSKADDSNTETQEQGKAEVVAGNTSSELFPVHEDEDLSKLNKFIEDTESMVFSKESLMKVVEIAEDTTTGELKKDLKITPEYSSSLTPEQIAEMDNKSFVAPDWALISLKPFDTVETLTVTMKNGDVFEIKVTDASNAFGDITVHFVDREGNPLIGVSYDGGNSKVTDNGDGTFTIPYDWDGTEGDINLKSEFSKAGYTYSSSRLAGIRDGETLTYEGLSIDYLLSETNGKLYFRSDRGYQDDRPQQGNLGFNTLFKFDFAQELKVPKNANSATTVSGNSGTTVYVSTSTGREIYVVMDPVPSGSSDGGDGGLDIDDPKFEKKLVSNGDGTYTLSLTVTGSDKNTEENPKANVLFVVDTSSSMTKTEGTETGHTRLADTKEALKKFGKELLAANSVPGKPSDTIEINMISFDGKSKQEMDDWTKQYSDLENAITNGLKTYTGTDYEDGLKLAYDLAADKKNKEPDEAMFVVFFTDGEASQYTNFNGQGSGSGSTGYRYWYSYFLSREAAKDEARLMISDDIELFSIFAFNKTDTYYTQSDGTKENGADLLHNLTKYAYNTGADLTGKRFFHAKKTSELNDAFAKILNLIHESVAIDNVKVNDNITELTSVGLSNLTSTSTGFKYTISGGKYGTEEQTWAEAPNATYDANGVHWNLSGKRLEDGVKYKCSFVVWPNQDAYDWVADLNNGIKDWDDVKAAGLDSHFLRIADSSKPSGYRYEVMTNPPSRDENGKIINNEIEYKKTHIQVIGNLPDGKEFNKEYVVKISDYVTETTVYTQNPDGTVTQTTVTQTKTAFGPPDLNMKLDDTNFKLEKKWVVGRPIDLVEFLYNTSTGEVIEENKDITFAVKKDTGSTPYKEVKLGYNETTGVFDWYGDTQEITVGEHTYTIGTIWEEPLDIALGLMLTPDKAQERGIDLDDPKYIPVYENEEATGEPSYYVLEKGHDYTVDEPTLDYRFEFETDIYHPMLVNDKPRDVKLKYKTEGGREIAILESISPEQQKLDTLTGTNILRGQLKFMKIALDPSGNRDTSAETKAKEFPITVKLTNSDAPFYIGGTTAEENVPWYGVQKNGEGNFLYFHKTEPNPDGTIVYVHEHDACVNGDYTNGLIDGYAGNVMTASDDHKEAEATIYASPFDVWTIANIPGETSYELSETQIDGYVFVKAEEIDSDPENIVEYPDDPDISGMIHSNHTTYVEITNQKLVVPIDVTIVKVDIEHLNDPDPETLIGATFTLEKYTDKTYQSLDLTWGDEVSGQKTGKKTLTDVNRNGKFEFKGLAEGFYKIVEDKCPDGYIKADGDPIFEARKDSQGKLIVVLLEKKTDGSIVDVQGNNDGTVRIENKKAFVGNTPGAELPHTGGPGTGLFIGLGSILILMAGVLLVAKKRII